MQDAARWILLLHFYPRPCSKLGLALHQAQPPQQSGAHCTALHWVAVCEDREYLQFIYHTYMQQLFPETSPEAEKLSIFNILVDSTGAKKLTIDTLKRA